MIQTQFQMLVQDWMYKCFSSEIVNSVEERGNRFIEEATELVQSLGMTKEQILKIVDYVFDREQGDINQEIGGVMITLAALCNRAHFNMETEGMREYFRISTPEMINKIRSKQRVKEDTGVAIQVIRIAGS